MAKQMEAHLHEESKLWSFIVLFQSQSRMQGGKTEESNMKNSRGQKLLDIFRVLSGVHFMHTISRFEAREVRSPTFQTVHKLELKRRSYGHLKTTASSCAKISQLRNHLQAHVCHFASSNSSFAATNQVAKSSPTREVTFKLRNHKFNLQNGQY